MIEFLSVFPWSQKLAVVVARYPLYHPAALRNIINIRSRVTHCPAISFPLPQVNHLAVSAVIFPGALDVLRVNWRDGFTVLESLELGKVRVSVRHG